MPEKGIEPTLSVSYSFNRSIKIEYLFLYLVFLFVPPIFLSFSFIFFDQGFEALSADHIVFNNNCFGQILGIMKLNPIPEYPQNWF